MNLIDRPLFYEGQTLKPAALNTCVDYPRNQLARHERYLHTPGIVTGLQLTLSATTVTVAPGVAIDAAGREVILLESQILSLTDLNQVAVNGTYVYPVFLTGNDERAAIATSSYGCSTAQSENTVEKSGVEFGHPGQLPATPNMGVGDALPPTGTSVLIGFVQSDLNLFTAAPPPPDGASISYAGALADQVIARGSQLALKTTIEGGGKPAQLRLNEKGSLVFGAIDAGGQFTTALTVTSTGDLTAAGVLTGRLIAGGIFMLSGTVRDGIKIPLPPAVTEQQVTDGTAVVHIALTPRPRSGATTAVAGQLCIVSECSVDNVTRTLSCSFDWIDMTTGLKTNLPGSCDYVLIASVPPTTT